MFGCLLLTHVSGKDSLNIREPDIELLREEGEGEGSASARSLEKESMPGPQWAGRELGEIQSVRE